MQSVAAQICNGNLSSYFFVIAFHSRCALKSRRRRSVTSRVRFFRGVALAIVLLSVPLLCSARDFALIVNKASSVRTLTGAELSKLANGSMPTWPTGGKVTFILRDPTTPAMKVALEKVFGMTADKLKAVMAANPGYFVVVNSDADVIRMVESLAGAVGLIDIYSITSGVNVVKLNGKLPLEPGYALHGN